MLLCSVQSRTACGLAIKGCTLQPTLAKRKYGSSLCIDLSCRTAILLVARTLHPEPTAAHCTALPTGTGAKHQHDNCVFTCPLTLSILTNCPLMAMLLDPAVLFCSPHLFDGFTFFHGMSGVFGRGQAT